MSVLYGAVTVDELGVYRRGGGGASHGGPGLMALRVVQIISAVWSSYHVVFAWRRGRLLLVVRPYQISD